MNVDIAIVGAGFAGLNLAHAIAGKGISVALIDKRKTFPDIFRAEKIEANQAAIMREIGTLKYRTPCSPPIGKTLNISGNRVFEVDTVEQYCMSYSETVNSLKRNLPSDVNYLNRVVSEFAPGDTGRVIFETGEELSAKLVVLACGMNTELIDSLGIARKEHSDLVSLTFGFDIKREDGSDFEFNGLNYFLPGEPDEVQYMTVFPIGERMRVNVFTQLSRKDGLSNALRNSPLQTLCDLFPDLYQHLGDVVLDSRVQVMPTTYYTLERQKVSGVVVIGDSFQSVSPATGSGLTKVLTDVKTLSETYIPRWMHQQSISAKDITAFYKNAEKAAADRHSLKSWFYADYGAFKKMSITGRVRRFILLALRHGVRPG